MKILAKPIEAVVWFQVGGNLRPIKFKYVDGDGRVYKIKVDRILQIDEVKIAGIRAFVYQCQSEFGRMQKRYELKYIVGECRWELYKM